MTINNPGSQAVALRFYQTMPHRCSYLAEREATTLFLDPQQPLTPAIYDALTQVGFRRSGRHLYRPHCQGCNACQSVRVQVQGFRFNRQQRKIWNRNQDLSWLVTPTRFTDEYYQLYRRYLESRHADGDMFPPSEEQFRSFLLLSESWARLVEFRDAHGQLLAVAAVDRLSDGLSAIYTFYDPEQKRRSLGVYAVLWQIEEARQQDLPHVYLGYWISECRKMSYKENYQPLEILQQQEWQPFPARDK
ncbi:arginyltransferase [Marinospirillum alkaliphilum]|uniref:Aspartate/glutamate leucyltransferase n=1 Tax=Marinospirillum alkaliphilum DSM 21637 TaxID=1122209 RepID=A0A1K1TT70_9GAMM|nr:arginyltransferase [Marinospirillum alkaliphilum]SFX03993.1 arginine-tRNA-protein transferase [Marinospirillum alkaliphilum DSM 21637]